MSYLTIIYSILEVIILLLIALFVGVLIPGIERKYVICIFFLVFACIFGKKVWNKTCIY